MAIQNPSRFVDVHHMLNAIEAYCDRKLQEEVSYHTAADDRHFTHHIVAPGHLSDLDLQELCRRYVKAGWHQVTATNEKIETEDGMASRRTVRLVVSNKPE